RQGTARSSQDRDGLFSQPTERDQVVLVNRCPSYDVDAYTANSWLDNTLCPF
ncbi:unnamed protein product, partial [Ascophyllum nodosum]